MKTRKQTKTIDQVFEEFLAEQKARLRPKTYPRYDEIVDLFRSCLEGYWPGHDQEEYNRITGAGGTYCGTWLEPFASGDREIGPVPVLGEVTRKCRVGWDISGVVVKRRKGWRLMEVWNVSP